MVAMSSSPALRWGICVLCFESQHAQLAANQLVGNANDAESASLLMRRGFTMAKTHSGEKPPRTFKSKAKVAGLVLLVLLSIAGVYQVYEWSLVGWEWYGENTTAVHVGLGLGAALLLVLLVLALRRKRAKSQPAVAAQNQGQQSQQPSAQQERPAQRQQQQQGGARQQEPAQGGAQGQGGGGRQAAQGPVSSPTQTAGPPVDDDARMRELEALEKELNL